MVNSRVMTGANCANRTRTRAARVFLLCSLATFVTVVIFLIFPAMIGGAWHLFKGGAANYKGWTVPVPDGFFAFYRNGGLYMARMERPSVKSVRRFDLLLITTLPLSTYFIFERDSRKFQEVESASAERRGLVERSTKTIRVGENIRYCVEFGRSGSGGLDTQAPEIQISCFIEGEPTTLTYSGRQMFSSEIYTVVQSMSKSSPVKAAAP